MTEILSVEPTATPDQLLVTGRVGDEDVQVFVWHSHLYGEPVDPEAKDKSGRYERAPDKLGGANKSHKHAEENAGPRDPQVPRTDTHRKAYLRAELERAAPVKADSKFSKLVDKEG